MATNKIKETENTEVKNTENTEIKNEETEMTTPETEVTETETPVQRIPEALANNPILAEFCSRYLSAFDEIAAYNKEVLTKSDSDWTQSKVLEQARKLGRPEDPKAKPNADIREVLVAYENAVEAMTFARKALMDTTAKELGISLSSTSERDPEREAPLKEKRKLAVEIGSQLSMIAKMTNDEAASGAVSDFLGSNPLPAIGRDQVRTFTENGTATPKYRVTVKVVNSDGTVLLEENGFTKTALALSQPVFGYERGKSLKSEDLRKAWESAGNTPDKTVQSTVEFEDNNLHYTITKK